MIYLGYTVFQYPDERYWHAYLRDYVNQSYNRPQNTVILMPISSYLLRPTQPFDTRENAERYTLRYFMHKLEYKPWTYIGNIDNIPTLNGSWRIIINQIPRLLTARHCKFKRGWFYKLKASEVFV